MHLTDCPLVPSAKTNSFSRSLKNSSMIVIKLVTLLIHKYTDCRVNMDRFITSFTGIKCAKVFTHALTFYENTDRYYEDSLVCGISQEGYSRIVVVVCGLVVRNSRVPAVTLTGTFAVCTPVSCKPAVIRAVQLYSV